MNKDQERNVLLGMCVYRCEYILSPYVDLRCYGAEGKRERLMTNYNLKTKAILYILFLR